jgi:hypothetical protein
MGKPRFGECLLAAALFRGASVGAEGRQHRPPGRRRKGGDPLVGLLCFAGVKSPSRREGSADVMGCARQLIGPTRSPQEEGQIAVQSASSRHIG